MAPLVFTAGVLLALGCVWAYSVVIGRRELVSRAEDALEVIRRRRHRFGKPGRPTLDAAIIHALSKAPQGHGTLVSDMSTGELGFSDGVFEALLGLPPDTLEGSGWTRYIHPEDIPTMALATSVTPNSGTYRYRHIKGYYIPIWFAWTLGEKIGVTYLRDAALSEARAKLSNARRELSESL